MAKFKIGDTVKLNGNKTYAYLRWGMSYQVIGVQEGTTGAISLFGVSGSYMPENFDLVRRKEEKVNNPLLPLTSLYIAVEISEYKHFTDVVDMINLGSPAIKLLSSTSGEKLKDMIRSRLTKHPYEKWVILYGNTLAQINTPEVKFSSL